MWEIMWLNNGIFRILRELHPLFSKSKISCVFLANRNHLANTNSDTLTAHLRFVPILRCNIKVYNQYIEVIRQSTFMCIPI